jgi:hypothetical protein
VRALATLAGLVALLAAAPAQAGFEPQNLHVVGGEETWHAERSFELRWSNPPGVAAVHYRVLSPSDEEVTEGTLGWPASAIEYLNVPAVPGIYGAEVWLEGTGGQTGPATSTQLRFDDAAPGRSEAGPVPDWIGRNAFPLTVRFGHPNGPEPLAGIRGYAFSVDRDPDGEPCGATRTCDESETDLGVGPGLVSVQIPGLPEGTNYLHAVAVSGSGMKSVTETVVLRVDATDPAAALFGATSGWSNQPVQLRALAVDAASGMATSGDGGTSFTAIGVDGDVPATRPGDTVSTTVVGSGVHTVAYYARDAAGNVADGVVVNGHHNAAPAKAVVRIDREPPEVSFATAQDPRDPERVEARVSDLLSGFDPTRGTIAVRPASTRQRFVPLRTEMGHNGLVARWNSAAYPSGPYEFRATAYDLAGNVTSTVLRSNGSRMMLRSPLKTATTLTAGFIRPGAPYMPVSHIRRTGNGVRVRYGASVLFGGRLIAGRRTPLAGRSIRVLERFDSGGERASTVRTGRDGSFAVRLPPGPSREVVATTAPTATLSGASSRPARLVVAGRVSLRASTSVASVGGRPVVFSGRVGAAPIPPGGKAVELQFRLPGLPWSEFRTVTTDARGRFRYAYRFVDDDSRGARFQFRASAPAQAGWPYEAAGSRSVTVRGI